MSIRVAVVEDNEVFREALEILLGLAADISVVASVADGESAVAACRASDPDVALVDYRLPGLDGVETIRAILADRPQTRVVVLSAQADEHEVEALLAAGACAYLTKDRDLDAIVSAIRDAAARPG